MDLLALENAQPRLVGGSAARRITSTTYFTTLDVSGTVGALSLTQNAQAVLDVSTALGGDLSGTHGAATVAKIQGRSVLSSLPNDGDVLTWVNGNSRWEAVAPSTGVTYYTVLDSTATTAQLNTALSTYNVVYLEPGVYGSVTGAITIPGSKQLIGLTGPGSGGSSYKPEIALVTGGGVTVTLGRGSLVENINWKFGPASTGSMLYAGNVGDNAVVRACEFSGNGVGTTQWAVQGEFKEVSGCYFYRCYGTTLSSTITPDGGTIRFFDNNWVGHSTDTGSNYGLQIAGNSVHVHDCNFEGGTAGIVASNVYYLQISNVTCVNQFGSGYGIYAVGTLGRPYLCTFSNIHIYGNNGGTVTGFYATGDYNVYDGIYVYDVSNYGIYISGSDNATFGEMAVAGCGSAWTASGIYLDTVTNSSFVSLSASSSGADGVRVSNCVGISVGTVSVNSNGGNGLNLFTGNSGCTFGDVTANSNTANGIAAPNGTNTNCTIVSATTNSNGSDGVDVAAGEVGLHFVGGTATGNTGWGFLGGNSGTPVCRLDSWYAHNNTVGNISLGTGWLNYATPVASGDTAGGDLSGTYPNPTVAKVQNVSWLSGAPADRQVPTYDGGNVRWEYQWPGMTNFSEARTFTVLDSTATGADINTALTNYDTVYLKPGSYSCGTTTIFVGGGKQLLGLGSRTAILTYSGNPTTTHVDLYGQLDNIRINIHSSAAVPVVTGQPYTSIVRNVYVFAAVSVNVFAFYGYFEEIRNVTSNYVNGIDLISASTNEWTTISVFDFNSVPTYGIRLADFEFINVSDGRISGGSYGLYLTTSAVTGNLRYQYFDNITVVNPTITGFYVSGTATYDIAARFDQCRVYGLTTSTDRGFYANYADNSTWTNCYAEYCNGTAAQAYGAFCVENSDHIQVSNCYGAYSTNTNNCDFWFNVVNYSTFTGLDSRGSYTGAHWYNNTCFGNAVSAVTVRDQTNASGYALYYNGYDATLSSIKAYNSTSRILFAGTYLAVSSVVSYNSTNIGVSLNAGSSTYSGIESYSAGSYGITTGASFIAASSLSAQSGASVGIYIDSSSTYSSFTGLVATANTSYGVQLVNALTRVQVSGVTTYNNGNYGFYAGSLTASTIGDVLAYSNTAGGGFFIGTNDYVSICNVNSVGNTGNGYSRGTSPTTANTSTSAIITSKANSTNYVTSASWNTNGEY